MMRSTVLFLAGLMPATSTGLKGMYSHSGGVGGDLGDVGGPPCYPILDLDDNIAHDDNIVFMDRLALGEYLRTCCPLRDSASGEGKYTVPSCACRTVQGTHCPGPYDMTPDFLEDFLDRCCGQPEQPTQMVWLLGLAVAATVVMYLRALMDMVPGDTPTVEPRRTRIGFHSRGWK